jgi:hypothetical protein
MPDPQVRASGGLREGEIIVDSQRAADAVRSGYDLRRALFELTRVADLALDLNAIAEEAERALRAEPDYDALPTFVMVDSSWADTLPACLSCGQDVPWAEALLMPCSTVEDGDADAMGVVHRHDCPSTKEGQTDAA